MPTPNDKNLYEKIKKKIIKDNPKHSAYRSGLIVKTYKEAFAKKYNKKKSPYKGTKPKTGLTRWFKEEWRNQRNEVGYKYPNDIYRPTKRISKKTPITMSELTDKELKSAMKKKAKYKRVNRFRKSPKTKLSKRKSPKRKTRSEKN